MDLIVTVVRHGNTFEAGEPPRRIGARTDLPLVASGCAQADALGAAFVREGVVFDRALSAPLLRTRATTERTLAGQPRAVAVESAEWLTEIDHGPDEGKLESEVVARIGHRALSAWDAEALPPDGWIVGERQRLQGWRNVWDGDAGHILIVTSNGAARFALRSDAGLWRQASALPSLKLRTGAYGVIARDAGGLRIVAWDRRP